MCFRRRRGDGNHFAFDLRYELIATAHHRRDKALVLRPLPQCFAQSGNMHLEVAFLHHSLRPRASHELFLGDELAPTLDERRQQVQGASANRHARTAIEQCLLRRDEAKRSEPVRYPCRIVWVCHTTSTATVWQCLHDRALGLTSKVS